MAGHGGLRPGAGRPQGGISETRRLLLRGIKRGLAQAGRARGIQGDEDEVATEAVARIASDLILAGQGRDVLAIFAQAAPKGDEGGGGDTESPLQQALRRMPGLQNGTAVPLVPLDATPIRAEPMENDTRPTDPASVTRHGQPFFSPQQTLLPPGVEASPAVPIEHGGVARADDAGARGGRATRPDPPTPHPAAPPPSVRLHTENFEKFPSEIVK